MENIKAKKNIIKSVLKKSTGVGIVLSEIPNTIKGMIKNLGKGNIQKGIDPGNILGNTWNHIKKQNTIDNKSRSYPGEKFKKEMEDDLSGKISYHNK